MPLPSLHPRARRAGAATMVLLTLALVGACSSGDADVAAGTSTTAAPAASTPTTAAAGAAGAAPTTTKPKSPPKSPPCQAISLFVFGYTKAAGGKQAPAEAEANMGKLAAKVKELAPELNPAVDAHVAYAIKKSKKETTNENEDAAAAKATELFADYNQKNCGVTPKPKAPPSTVTK